MRWYYHLPFYTEKCFIREKGSQKRFCNIIPREIVLFRKFYATQIKNPFLSSMKSANHDKVKGF